MTTATQTSDVRIIARPELDGKLGVVNYKGDYYLVEDQFRTMVFEKLITRDRHIVRHHLGSARECSCKGFKYGKGKACRHMQCCEEILAQW